MTEQWIPVPTAPGYEVSDAGRVRSVERVVARTNGRPYRVRGRALQEATAKSGHLRVTLHIADRTVTRLVHQLVLEAFVGPRPAGLVCRHADDDPTNNSLHNLRWGTHRENQRDRVRNGRDPRASRATCPAGHSFTPDNTRLNADGGRACRACQAAASRLYRSKKSGVTA